MSNADFDKYYKKNLALIEVFLKKSFTRLPLLAKPLEDAMQYSLFAGGKRLRPLLLLATLKSVKKDTDFAMPFAAAIEYIHTYSLMHDDLPCMDNDDLRRGKPTCHIRYGEDMALLAGDAILTHAFYLISTKEIQKTVEPAKILKCVHLLSKNAGIFGMVAGQAADILHHPEGNNAQELEFIHSHKTGALIAASILIGGILAGLDDRNLDLLESFGKEIGKCFQIQDDILDETASTEELGKPSGSDIKNQKLTYLKIYGIVKSKVLAEKSLKKALGYLDNCDYKFTRLKELADFILNRSN
ncbi:MAG: polyprenyl synthetase family protein [Deltaproteobacteria bacterium]|nr:polyprenyl synthetase family protein [Deltaproteobacteria bacterium]